MDLIKSIDDDGIEPTSEVKVDPDTWSKDRAVRERLILQRKQAMLLKARQYGPRQTIIYLFISFAVEGSRITQA